MRREFKRKIRNIGFCSPPLFFLLISINFSLQAQTTFRYRHQSGEQWHFTSQINEKIYIDGNYFNEVEILNKISVEVLKGNGGDGFLLNEYKIAEKSLDKDVYTWSKEEEARYARDTRGRVSGFKKNTSIPPVRNVPVYPDEPVHVFDTWSELGLELFDLEPTFGINEIITIDFTAHYRYLGTEILEGKEIEKISIRYTYDWQPVRDLLLRMQKYEFYPVGIVGQFQQNIYWDPLAGRNYGEDGNFSYTYTMQGGGTYEFSGTSKGRARYVDAMDRESIVKDLEDIGDLDPSITEDGVRIEIDNIMFISDRAEMLPGEEEKLIRIGEFLRTIPERDIMVVGHTASVDTGSDGKELSEARARTVAQYFIDTRTRKTSQIIVRGMGDSQPVAYNDNEEGRRKNRRVEIIILEN